MLDNLKFWKKKDDDLFIDDDLRKPISGIDDDFGADTPQNPRMMPPNQEMFQNPGMHQAQPHIPEQGRDFTVKETSRQMFQGSSGNDELILAKLDAIKAMVENVSRRLERIEQIAIDEEKKGY